MLSQAALLSRVARSFLYDLSCSNRPPASQRIQSRMADTVLPTDLFLCRFECLQACVPCEYASDGALTFVPHYQILQYRPTVKVSPSPSPLKYPHCVTERAVPEGHLNPQVVLHTMPLFQLEVRQGNNSLCCRAIPTVTVMTSWDIPVP